MAKIPEYRPFTVRAWRFLWYPARVIALLWRYRLTIDEPLPDGPLVVAANHLSHLDPPFLGLAIRRPTRFLALDELWRAHAGFARVLGFFGSIPLPREGRVPIAAMRESLRHLAGGGIVGLFPEGRRVRAWGEEPPRRGAAWLAIRRGVPLVPVAIWGTHDAMPVDDLRLRIAPIRVHVGAAFDPSDFADADDPVGALTEAWRQWIDRALAGLAD